MKLGDRVVSMFPDGIPGDVGTIIDGPIVRDGKAVFKVKHAEYDNWLPVDWLRPFIQKVQFGDQGEE